MKILDFRFWILDFRSRSTKYEVRSTMYALLIAAAFSLASCYSFTGASVPPHLKTVVVPTAEDASGFGRPAMREDLTQRLVQRFISDNSLRVVSSREDANALLETTIRSVTDVPQAVSTGGQVASRKVEITVDVKYTDQVKSRPIWQNTFTSFGEYPQTAGRNAQDAIITKVFDRIADDILRAVVSNW